MDIKNFIKDLLGKIKAFAHHLVEKLFLWLDKKVEAYFEKNPQ